MKTSVPLCNRLKILLLLAVLSTLLPAARAWGAEMELPEELRQIPISEQATRSNTAEVGVVTSLTGSGRMVVLHKRLNAGHYGKERDPVFEEDAVFSLKDCRGRIEFRDKTVIMLAPESHIDIGEVAMSVMKGEKRASFEMMKGKAIFYALPLFGYKDMKFQVKTTTALIGVRGTKFGVEVGKIREGRSERGRGRLASLQPMLAQERQGGENVLARIYVFEGFVDVTSLVDGKKQSVRENEILEVDFRGLGEIRVDPARTRSFVEEVAGKAESDSAPRRSPEMMQQRYLREEMDRLDRLEDMKQRQITPIPTAPVTPHAPSGGHSH